MEKNNQTIQTFFQDLNKTEVKKGTVLQRKGDSHSKAFYVESGLLRSYSIDEKGKEHIYMFAPEDWVVSDAQFEVSSNVSELYIDALEDSSIRVFDARERFKFLEEMKHDELLEQTDKLMRRVAVLQKRVIMLMSATATERYEMFLKTYPNIVQRVPQKMIASYLGITPEALSKIRRNLVK